MVFKTFIGKLFARNEVFREMERQCAERVMKMAYSLEVGCKADLTSKVEIGNACAEFDRSRVWPLPDFSQE